MLILSLYHSHLKDIFTEICVVKAPAFKRGDETIFLQFVAIYGIILLISWTRPTCNNVGGVCSLRSVVYKKT